MVTEIKKASENMSLWDRWTGRQWDYNQLVEKLGSLAVDVKKSRLTNEEVPILRRISEKTRTRHSAEQISKDSTGGSMKLSPKDPSIGLSTQMDDIDKTLKALIAEARDVRRRITTGAVGGTYFQGLTIHRLVILP